MVSLGNVGLVLRAVLQDKDCVSKQNTLTKAPTFFGGKQTNLATFLQPAVSNRRSVVYCFHYRPNWLVILQCNPPKLIFTGIWLVGGCQFKALDVNNLKVKLLLIVSGVICFLCFQTSRWTSLTSSRKLMLASLKSSRKLMLP